MALYGTPETGDISNQLDKTFAPPMSGWKVFDGTAPAPSLQETSLSKRTSSMASMAAAAARLKGESPNRSSNRSSTSVMSSSTTSKTLSPVNRISSSSAGSRSGTAAAAAAAVPVSELFVPVLLKLLCKSVKLLGGYESEGIFRKAGNRSAADSVRKTIARGDYTVLTDIGKTAMDRMEDQGSRPQRSSSTYSSSGDWSDMESKGDGSSATLNHERTDTNVSNVSSGFTASNYHSNHHHHHHHRPSANKVQLKDADVAADVLKQWLRAMPEPLIAYNTYNDAIDAGNEKSLEKAIKVLRALNEEHRQTLMYLLTFLREVAQTESVTKMGSCQLAIVFMPNIIKSPHLDENPAIAIMNANPEKEFVTMLIEHFDEIEEKVGW